MTKIAQLIEKKLTDSLNPVFLEIIDQSHLHASHLDAGNAVESHFKIRITAQQLSLTSLILAHRLIHKILADELKIIHALSIEIIHPQ